MAAFTTATLLADTEPLPNMMLLPDPINLSRLSFMDSTILDPQLAVPHPLHSTIPIVALSRSSSPLSGIPDSDCASPAGPASEP